MLFICTGVKSCNYYSLHTCNWRYPIRFAARLSDILAGFYGFLQYSNECRNIVQPSHSSRFTPSRFLSTYHSCPSYKHIRVSMNITIETSFKLRRRLNQHCDSLIFLKFPSSQSIFILITLQQTKKQRSNFGRVRVPRPELVSGRVLYE